MTENSNAIDFMFHPCNMATTDDASASVVQAVCGCSLERAMELLEAGGSIERAVDVHFSQQEQHHDDGMNSSSEEPAGASAFRYERQVDEAENEIIISWEKPKHMQSPNEQEARLPPLFESDPVQHKSTGKIDSKLMETRSEPSLKETSQHMSKKARIDYSKDSQDDRLQYARLAEAFAMMADTTKRLAKLDILQQVLRDIIDGVGGTGHGDEVTRREDGKILQYAIELIVGSTLKLQVSGSAVTKAVTAVTGASPAQLRTSYRQTGDLGDVAGSFLRNQRLLMEPKPLTILAVYETLKKIAATEGKGSQSGRQAIMVTLLRSCKSLEIRFLVRTLLGNMRLGANIRTVMAALAMAVNKNTETNDEAVKIVQDTFDYCPRLDKACLALLVGGVPYMVKTCTLEVGTCISPMLANPAHSLVEVAAMMLEGGPIVAEWKYDGVRCQAHFTGAKVILFSRHMLENTDQFPDVVNFFLKARKGGISSFIIDAEIVGIEQTDNGECRLLPFQDLSTRRGMRDEKDKLAVRVFAFDLMFLNGESLVKKPLGERQRLLAENFNVTDDFKYAESIVVPKFDEPRLTRFLESALVGGAEGLMVKLTGEMPDNENENPKVIRKRKGGEKMVFCQYESGVRSHTWLKVKRDYVAGFADTIDVVPIGAWYGNGRKAQKGFLSPVLLAVYDEDEDVFRSICRCMSFTDAMYNAMRAFYFKGTPYPDGVGVDEGECNVETETRESDDDTPDRSQDSVGYSAEDEEGEESFERVNCYPNRPVGLVVTDESPSIWFKPSEVFEVSFADLTLSKQHSAAAGLVDPNRGVALRFPRFKRRRPDKRVDQATSSTQIAELFSKQIKQRGPST